MAELSSTDATLLMTVFAEAYNTLHGSDFIYDVAATEANDRAPGSNRDLSVDYICSSPGTGTRVFVQHTEAWSDFDSERAWARRVGLVRKGVEAAIRSRADGPFAVSLSIARAPSSPDEARNVIKNVNDEIEKAIAAHPGQRRVSWARGRTDCVSDISLNRLGGSYSKSIVIASDSMSRFDPVGHRAERALEHKMLRYAGSAKDLTLLIHYRVTEYDSEDLLDITEAVKRVPHAFKEVWVYSDWWIDEPRIHRVWAD